MPEITHTKGTVVLGSAPTNGDFFHVPVNVWQSPSTEFPEGGPLVAGIDPSLTGFAVTLMSRSNPNWFRTWVASPTERGVVRLGLLSNMTWRVYESTVSEYEGPAIPLEDVFMEGTVRQSASASVLGELAGAVKLGLYEDFHLAPLQVPPSSLKKFVAGKGAGVSKSQMLLEVYRKWGVAFPDDNAADSYGLARMAVGDYQHLYEKEVVLKLEQGGAKFRDVV